MDTTTRIQLNLDSVERFSATRESGPQTAYDSLRQHLQDATLDLHKPGLERFFDDVERTLGEQSEYHYPALEAMRDEVFNPAIERVLPKIADLLDEAIRDALPWYWPKHPAQGAEAGPR